MGLRNLFARHRTPEPAWPSPAPARIESFERVSLTAEQQADLKTAQAEFLQAVGQAGANQLHACGRGGSRWHDDPQALRAISELLRDLQVEEKNH